MRAYVTSYNTIPIHLSWKSVKFPKQVLVYND